MADDNWDLQAVVRGYGGVKAAAVGGDPLSSFDSSSSSSSSSSCPSLLLHDNRVVAEENLLSCFQDHLARPTALQELQDLCKPFFPKSSLPPLQQQQQQQKQNLLLPNLPMPQPHLPLTPHSKKRKSQLKKVVCHVPAGSHSNDMWAWRKYGQKPIKGSPFPRGYYRCSSSKTCIARKQVERSKTDPSVFVVTYTGEHNHPIPTHRNSLAGSTRHKLASSSSITTTTSSSSQQAHMVTAAAGLSPTTPLAASTEEEEKEEEEEEEEDYCDEDLLLASDMEMLDEDSMLFLGRQFLPPTKLRCKSSP